MVGGLDPTSFTELKPLACHAGRRRLGVMEHDDIISRDPDLVEIGKRAQAAIALSKELVAQSHRLALTFIPTTALTISPSTDDTSQRLHRLE